MAFGGGGGGAITAHVHDNTPSEGGPLDFGNVTIASMAQGSVTYSDGAALQELVAPAPPAGEVLSFQPAATAPSWSAAAAGGSYQFLESFVFGADSQTQETTLSTPYIYNDFDHLVLRFNLKTSVTTDGVCGISLRYANSATTYYTTNYQTIGCLTWNPVGVARVVGNNECINLMPDTATGGSGVNNGSTIVGEISFYNGFTTGTHYTKPFYYNVLKGENPLMFQGVGRHEDAVDRAELSSFEWAVCVDDYTVPVGTFEILQDSFVNVYRVANS